MLKYGSCCCCTARRCCQGHVGMERMNVTVWQRGHGMLSHHEWRLHDCMAIPFGCKHTPGREATSLDLDLTHTTAAHDTLFDTFRCMLMLGSHIAMEKCASIFALHYHYVQAYLAIYYSLLSHLEQLQHVCSVVWPDLNLLGPKSICNHQLDTFRLILFQQGAAELCHGLYQILYLCFCCCCRLSCGRCVGPVLL